MRQVSFSKEDKKDIGFKLDMTITTSKVVVISKPLISLLLCLCIAILSKFIIII